MRVIPSKSEFTFQKIYSYVKSCLEKADVDRFGSITFPTIGTGGFKFPDITSATKTFEAIYDFFKRQKTNLHTVRLVMFPQAQMSIQVRAPSNIESNISLDVR